MSGFFSSSIGKKFMMSISGLCLLLFLLFHMSMNLVAVFSGEAYNKVCEFLGTNWYALAGTAFLALGFLVHIVYAFILTFKNRAARGNDRYAVDARPKNVEWASQNMLVIGIIVLAGICLHLSQFWAKMMYAELAGVEHQIAATDGTGWIQFYFSQPLIVVCYVIWIIAIWFHLCHGFWSALQTIGWSNLVWLSRIRTLANWFSTIVCCGFLIIVLGYFFGIFPLYA